jgi:hypothetical protein
MDAAAKLKQPEKVHFSGGELADSPAPVQLKPSD